VALEAEQKAPFSGVLLTVPKANELRRNTIELEHSKKIIESLDKSIALYAAINAKQDERIKAQLEQNDVLALRLQDSRDLSSWERIGWFTLGVVGTGLAAYGVNQIVRQ